LIFAFSRPGRQDILHSSLVIAGVIVLSAVWWIDILALHGSSNFVGAFFSRSALSLPVRLAQLYSFEFTTERLLDILGVMALIGLVRKIIDRNFFFLAWLVAIFLLERTSPLPLVAIPLGMLIGVGVDILVFHNTAVSTPYGKRVYSSPFVFLYVIHFSQPIHD
jgi:hypothetical protein